MKKKRKSKDNGQEKRREFKLSPNLNQLIVFLERSLFSQSSFRMELSGLGTRVIKLNL